VAGPRTPRWRTRVGGVLARGCRSSLRLIGLPWPGTVRSRFEVHTPSWRVRGVLRHARDEITVSEDLDDLTIVHEATHAWFNSRLFTERWIARGWPTSTRTGCSTRWGGADDPDRGHRGADVPFPLNDWPPPPRSGRGRRPPEQYGYDASWHVVRRIARDAGEDGMRAAFAAADGRTPAYLGAGPAEPTRLPNDWRRFLDLVEELGGAQDVDELLATWALTDDEAATLAARSGARDAYHALVADGDGWAAPAAVRLAMDAWAFDDAEAAAAAATRVLERRDEAEVAGAGRGPHAVRRTRGRLRGRGRSGRAGGRRDARRRDAGVAPDLLPRPRTPAGRRGTGWRPIGLDGTDPDADLAAARAAWEAGRSPPRRPACRIRLGRAGGGAGAGPQKALLVGAAVAAGLAVLVAVLLASRHRRRARARRAAAAIGSLPVPGSGPDGYVTLPPSVAPGAPFDAGRAWVDSDPGPEPGPPPDPDGDARLGPEPGPPSDEERGAEPS